ncbi:MAG: DUF3040 domain-containing protein [Actinomycetota bacterium]
MPLSEHEQKILQEIERNLYQEDPSFARGVRGRRRRFSEAVRARLGIVVFVVGIAAMFAFFISGGDLILGVIAFAAMLCGIVLFANSVKGLFTGGPQERLSRLFKGWEERARQRYKKD